MNVNGSYVFGQVMLLWKVSACSYGLAYFFIKEAIYLADIINDSKNLKK